jgi:zinc transport system substrate-binding protein
MKPSDAAALGHSDVFFRVSEATEPFTAKLVEALPERVRVVTLADAPGVTRLDVRTGGTFEARDHEGTLDAADGRDALGHHPSVLDAKPIRPAKGSRDGHVWLDPANARHMVAEIARVLAEVSPEDAEALNNNAERVIAGIVELEREIARVLEPVRGQPFIVFHDAYQYFERRFGVPAAGSITVSPQVQPSAKRLSEIRSKIGGLGVTCVFGEPQLRPDLVAAVTEGTAARSGTLDPEGTALAPGPESYATLLRNLAAGLTNCLAEGGSGLKRGATVEP